MTLFTINPGVDHRNTIDKVAPGILATYEGLAHRDEQLRTIGCRPKPDCSICLAVRGESMIERVVEEWHAYLRGELPGGLDELLDDEVVFYSPIVFTPQRGKAITSLYLQAARQAFPGDAAKSEGSGSANGFHYTKFVLGDDTAILEFETTIEGKYVNGVDIIRCNEAGRITEFRVMIRPLQAVNLVHQQMAALLEKMAPED
jgi:hypothetical protein